MSGGVTAKRNISFDQRMKLVRTGAKGSMQRQISATPGAPVMTTMPGRQRGERVLWNIVLGFGAGFVGLLSGKLAIYHLLPEGAPVDAVHLAGLAAIGDLGAGAAAALLLGVLLTLRPFMAKVAVAGGYATLMYGEADIALNFPQAWDVLFSPAYTAQAALGEQMLPQLLALAG